MKKFILIKIFIVFSAVCIWAEPLVIEWNGDLRYRNEGTFVKGSEVKRFRQRVKAKLGLLATKDNQWFAGLELATGASDPVSNNMTLGNDFATADFGLNLAFLNFKNDLIELNMGKYKNPLVKVQKNELVWDGDLNPEGLSAQIQYGHKATFEFITGAWVLQERSKAAETWIQVNQLVFNHDLESYKYQFTFAYNDYHNIEGKEYIAANGGGNSGNGSKYNQDYNLLDLGLELSLKLLGLPINLAGAFVQNLAVDNENNGFYTGITVGKAKAANTMQGSLSYRQIEANATLGALTDSDFNGGGTQGRGFEFNFKYQVSGEVSLVVSQFLTETIDVKKSGKAVTQIDFNYKF